MPAQYFVSYVREDSKFALRLASDLRAVGVNLWLDQLDILGGDRWDRAIESALNSCPCMIAIMSPESLASTNVMDEVSFALEEGKLVVPVLLRSCKVPFRLRRLQYVDFSNEYDSGFAQLLRALGVEAAPDMGESLESGAQIAPELREHSAVENPDLLESTDAPIRPRKRFWPLSGMPRSVPLLLSIGLLVFFLSQQFLKQQQLNRDQLNVAKRQILEPVDIDNDSGDLIREKMATALETLAALGTEHRLSGSEIAEILKEAPAPWRVFEFGPAGIPDEVRPRRVLEAVRNAHPFLVAQIKDTLELIEFAPDPVGGPGRDRDRMAELGAALWSLDRFAIRDSATTSEAQQLRAGLVQSLREEFGIPPVEDEAHWIPFSGATFRMGSTQSDNLDEIPVHDVAVSNFEISRHEATNEEMGRFLPAWKSKPPTEPAVGMTWFEAYVFAIWRGVRLPSESEWEYVARNGKEYEYPWGDGDPDCTRATLQGCKSAPTPVCSKPKGNTERGVCDMAGNVWEWVADWYDDYPGSEQQDALGPSGPSMELDGRVARGGSFKGTAETVRAAKRHSWPPTAYNQQTGVRLARDP